MMKTRMSLAAVALLMLWTRAEATPICRWVDESGRTQIAQAVPEKYSKVAVCTDSQKYEPSPEQRQAAERRAAEVKARAARLATRTPADRAASSPRPAAAASQPAVKRPAEAVTDETDCKTWWRIYDESVECFGPYRTTRGATKVEGLDKCNVITSPELKCGPRTR